MRTLMLLVAALGLATLAVAAPPTYVATQIGPFPGGQQSSASGINSKGDVTGWAEGKAWDEQHAFIFSGGVLTDLGAPTGGTTIGRSINDSGQVAGYTNIQGSPSRGFLWTGSAMIDLGIPGAGSGAQSVNTRGDVVGRTWLGPETSSRRAFVYQGGSMFLLPTLGGDDASASGINDRGQITGYSTLSTSVYGYPQHAFLYANGQIIDLGTLGGANSAGYAINANGEVTGASDYLAGSNVQRAFVYSNGKMVDIGGRIPGGSAGNGINASSVVVGNADTIGQFENKPIQHAFVYVEGEIYDLNLLASGLNGIVLAYATGINDNGQIVAWGYPAKSGLPILGFRLDPVGKATFPAPSPAVEFYHAALDHYFLSADPKEIGDLDSGVHKGWVRTGKAFAVYASSATGMRPVCRFYIPPAKGDSHFFSASADECADVLLKTQTDPAYAGYVYETAAAFHVGLPDVATGACPIGMIAVYRLWNGRTDSNHRYTTDLAVRAEMLAKGYIPEGYGPGRVAMCAAGP